MANPENLKGKGFDKNPQNIGKGRPKGVKNRSTVLKKWLKISILTDNPITQQEEKLTVEELMTLNMIKKVIEDGDLNTFKEIQDSLFGKITDKIETQNTHDFNQLPELKIIKSDGTD